MPLTETIIGAGVKAVTGECLRRHGDDIQKAGKQALKATNKAVDDGWKRDYEAGGISNPGRNGRTATA